LVKILIFDINANYGCFKKFYTTSSILTYDIPPKTSLIGLICSILGYERNSDKIIELSNIKIGILILNPVNKIHQGINWLNTKVKSIKLEAKVSKFLDPISEYSVKDFYGFIGLNKNKPSNLQLLKNPKFRLFVSDENFEDFEKLVESIKNHQYEYSPYLGQSEFLCSIMYIDEIDSDLKKSDDKPKKLPINSVIPQSYILKDKNENYELDISEDSSIIAEQMPLKYERDITKFHKVIYDKSGNAILARVKEFYEISSPQFKQEYNIILF